MASRGAEYKAGLVVLAGLIVLCLGLFLVSGGADQFRKKKRYTVLFHDGGGIGTGDAVYLAGRRVGKVVSVDEKETTRNGVEGTYVSVEVEVFDDARVHTDSPIFVSKTITGIVTLNMKFGPSGELAGKGAVLAGEKRASFDEAIDEASKLLEGAGEIVRHVDQAVVAAKEAIEELDVAALQAKAETFLDELNAGADKLERIIANAEPKVEEVLKKVDSGVGDFDKLAGALRRDWDEIAATTKATLNSARKAAAELEGILKENRPGVRTAIQGIADGALRVAPVLLQIEKLAQAAEDVVLDVGPKLKRGLTDAADAFKNFEGVTEDLKTSPWKLINEPSYEETMEVFLYNAARNYIDSAEKIKDVLAELEALRQRGTLGDEKMKERVEELTARLEISLQSYDQREKELVKLLERAKNGKKK